MKKDYKISEPFFEYGPKCYMYGKGVARNFLTAEKYLTLAKERGNPHAQSYIDKLP